MMRSGRSVIAGGISCLILGACVAHVGSPGYGGPMVTAGGLVFIGATRDRRFRAFDSRTGKELWSAPFDYNVTAIPITFLGRNGKQHVAVVAAANGQGHNEPLHVFTLP